VVGAFVLVLGSALIAGVLWIASGGAWKKQVDLYQAVEDESVSGLNLNAPVKYNGVEVGKVRSIKLDAVNPQRVHLVFAIERGTPIQIDTVAVLKTQGLTGIAYVELAGGSPNGPLLVATQEGELPMIRTKPSLSARLENVLTNVAAKLDSTSNNVNKLLSEENRLAFSSALADIATVSRTVAARQATLDTTITNLGRTMDNSARLSAQLTAQIDPMVARIARSAAAIEKMGNDTAAAGTQAGKTVEAVGADVQRLTAQTVPALQILLNDLSVLSASLRRLTEQTERNPASLIRGRGTVPDGPGEAAPDGPGESSPDGPRKASPIQPAIDAFKPAPAP
jgi:phospholipid/cholesterol/gamma-HCH transport system substrate-binding protein